MDRLWAKYEAVSLQLLQSWLKLCKLSIVGQMVFDAVPDTLTGKYPGEECLGLEAQLVLKFAIDFLLFKGKEATEALHYVLENEHDVACVLVTFWCFLLDLL